MSKSLSPSLATHFSTPLTADILPYLTDDRLARSDREIIRAFASRVGKRLDHLAWETDATINHEVLRDLTGYSRNTIYTSFRRLGALGVLELVPGTGNGGHRAVYRLNLSSLSPLIEKWATEA